MGQWGRFVIVYYLNSNWTGYVGMIGAGKREMVNGGVIGGIGTVNNCLLSRIIRPRGRMVTVINCLLSKDN